MGEELIPTRPANPADIKDPALRQKQEEDNIAFGRAIQDWNLHNYDKAYQMFLDHVNQFPDSPWAAESELHMGCYCQYQGKFDESEKWFTASQARSETGHAMNMKSTLRLGALAMEQGKLQRASEHFTSLHSASDSPSHSTYASYWIMRLSLMKEKQTAMRDCAQKSLAEVCAVFNKPDSVRKLRALETKNPNGFNLQEIEDLAASEGLEAQTVLTSVERLADLPLPFIAHYDREQHFVTVLAHPKGGKIKLYDTRVGHVLEADYTYFQKQWSGYAVVFAPVPQASGILLASAEAKRTASGGCCGLPKEPDDLECDKGDECEEECSSCGRAMPEWGINPVNMNLVVKDTPMWWDSPYGPSINMTLSYHSLDSLISVRPFGDKWTFAYSAYAMQDPSGSVLIIYGNAATERFSPNGSGGFTPQARNAGTKLTKTGTYTFIVETENGTKYTFSVPKSMAGASAASLLSSITDKYGSVVTISHNAQGAVTSITHPAGGTWNLIYNSAGKVARITDPFGREATFAYDAQNRLVGQTDMGGLSYGYGYTNAARVRERDPLYPNFGHSQEFVERSNELFLNVLTLPTGAYQFYTEPADGINNGTNSYPPAGGVMWENYRITVTDPLGQVEEFYYDGFSRAGWHRDKRYYKAGTNGANLPATRYFYTVAGGRGQISRINHQGGGVSEYRQLNEAGQPATVISDDGKTIKYTYNSKGHVLTRQEGEDNDPNKVTFTTTYAANNSDVISESKTIGLTTTQISGFSYDANGDVASETDHEGLTTAYIRNARGQITEVTNPRGGVTRNTYLSNGKLEKIEYKAPGETVYGAQFLYVYDSVGRTIAQTDADGYMLAHEYDNLNRRTKTTFPDGTFTQHNFSCCTLTSSRGRDGNIIQYGYDSLKRLVSSVAPGKDIITYQYDAVGNQTRFTFGRGEWVGAEYDAGNRPIARVYPDGSRITFGYDAYKGGRLTWIKDAQGRQTSYTYDAYNRVSTVSCLGLPTQTYTYDPEGRPLTWTDGTGSG
ncbi:MAG TPA: cysteine peptidase family C39 domain-containing protein, partial [Prosthecobacter sp.]|nr:cysteine peptidase family C39 domain-containing protein [Prosthecobacter sp.]